jgi:4-amino-4-deoxy-L-arabinose transferase-like glycosyltransferase
VTVRTSLSFAPDARIWRAVALAITLVGALALAATHYAFCNTYDEPAHIAAGVEWLSGHYDYDAQRPPLGRIAAGIGPYLYGERAALASSPTEDGARILGHGAHYRTTLALARLGDLPFFILLCAVVWGWGRRLTDERGAAIAVLLAATNPSLLAYAGLATTDIALTAVVVAALLAFVVWLDAPHWVAGLSLGGAVALAATADFIALPMLGLALPAIYAVRRRAKGTALWSGAARRRSLLAIALTIVAAVLMGWAVYGFSIGPVIDGSSVPMPAPGWFRGLLSYLTDTPAARPAFLLGDRSADGWWYYYPVALLVKTPLPLLLFATLGAAATTRDFVRRRAAEPATVLAAIVAVLLVGAIAGEDAGVRLVLPVVALLPLLGAIATVELWQASGRSVPVQRLVRGTVVASFAAALIVPLRAHPDYLAYFNPIAGDRPELILVDSNIDWGQDLYRLGAVMKRMRIDSIAVAYYGSASLEAAGVRNARLLTAAERPRGWIAASQTMLAGVGGDGAYEWLNELRPVGRVGSSLVLFYVPPRPRRYR